MPTIIGACLTVRWSEQLLRLQAAKTGQWEKVNDVPPELEMANLGLSFR